MNPTIMHAVVIQTVRPPHDFPNL